MLLRNHDRRPPILNQRRLLFECQPFARPMLSAAVACQHKVVFLGDSNTGKTSIIFKYLKLAQQPFPTIAASTYPITVSIRDNTINLSCWDTAGQESYRCLVPMYARDAEVAILVFDQSNAESFKALEKWLEYIQNDCGIKHIIVVSNKNDLDSVVPLDEAFEFCSDRKLPLVATSATTGSNISFLFIKIADMIYESIGERVQLERTVSLKTKGEESECC
jgi:small GTP-binding protein